MSSNSGLGISQEGFTAVLWTLWAVATVLLAGRLVIRFIALSRFHLDDVFAASAWVLTTAAIACQTASNPLTYRVSAILVGEAPPPAEPQQLADMVVELRRWNIAEQMLFWTTLLCVKLSFMFLYSLVLGSSSSVHKRLWRLGVVYVLLSYGICLIGVFGQCGDSRYLWSFQECMSPYVASLDAKLIWVDYFFNVSSDLVLMTLPLPLIWNLRIRSSQKLAISAVFCLALITIAFDTVRTVKLYQEIFELTALYSYLEFLIAVIICMLPSYRFLISNSGKNREYRRAFWYLITLRSRHSSASEHSLHSHPDYHRSKGANESHPEIPRDMISHDPPPVPIGIVKKEDYSLHTSHESMP